jgi:hypothetical protein
VIETNEVERLFTLLLRDFHAELFDQEGPAVSGMNRSKRPTLNVQRSTSNDPVIRAIRVLL